MDLPHLLIRIKSYKYIHSHTYCPAYKYSHIYCIHACNIYFAHVTDGSSHTCFLHASPLARHAFYVCVLLTRMMRSFVRVMYFVTHPVLIVTQVLRACLYGNTRFTGASTHGNWVLLRDSSCIA